MKTAREIYQTSLHLLGERSEHDRAVLEERAPDLINMILAELRDLDAALKKEAVRPGEALKEISSLDDNVHCEAVIAASLVPFALAAFLIQEEDSSRADYFYRLYSKGAEKLWARSRKGKRHKIQRPY